MNIRNKTVNGGASGMLGNIEQMRYAVAKVFEEEYIFFHQHITEDIEFHTESGITLIQVKRNDNKPSDVASALRSYLRKPDFIDFIISNKSKIEMWEWVVGTSKIIDKAKVLNLIVIDDILEPLDKNDPLASFGVRKVITPKSKVKEFVEILNKKMIIKNETWIRNAKEYEKHIFSLITVKEDIQNLKESKAFRAQSYLANQIDLLMRTPRKDIKTFKELRDEFLSSAKKDIIEAIENDDSMPLINDKLYKKIVALFGVFVSNVFISDFDKDYVIAELKSVDISEFEIKALADELRQRSENGN